MYIHAEITPGSPMSLGLPNLVNIINIYLKPQPSYYEWKIFTTAVLTLNFDLDLSEVNSDIWYIHTLNIGAKFRENRSCTFRKITTSVIYETTNELRINERTNQLTRQPTKTRSITVPCFRVQAEVEWTSTTTKQYRIVFC